MAARLPDVWQAYRRPGQQSQPDDRSIVRSSLRKLGVALAKVALTAEFQLLPYQLMQIIDATELLHLDWQTRPR